VKEERIWGEREEMGGDGRRGEGWERNGRRG